MTTLKKQLHSFCRNYVESRINACQEVIRSSQQSANEETKSSAGDKYETGRAMAQLEIEKATAQLVEATKLKQIVDHIPADNNSQRVETGSVVITTHGNFYIAISAGQITINNVNYFAISPTSPIGQRMIGLSVTDSFKFNNKDFVIEQVL